MDSPEKSLLQTIGHRSKIKVPLARCDLKINPTLPVTLVEQYALLDDFPLHHQRSLVDGSHVHREKAAGVLHISLDGQL
jgi:hypothetical protein